MNSSHFLKYNDIWNKTQQSDCTAFIIVCEIHLPHQVYPFPWAWNPSLNAAEE